MKVGYAKKLQLSCVTKYLKDFTMVRQKMAMQGGLLSLVLALIAEDLCRLVM